VARQKIELTVSAEEKAAIRYVAEVKHKLPHSTWIKAEIMKLVAREMPVQVEARKGGE
jgi:hypothetical protein